MVREIQVNRVIWLPVFMGLGIALYFTTKAHPYVMAAGGLLWLAHIISYILLRRKTWYQLLSLMLFITSAVVLGYFAAAYRTHSIGTRGIAEDIGPIRIIGKVEQFEQNDQGYRIYVSDIACRCRTESSGKAGTPQGAFTQLSHGRCCPVPMPDKVRFNWRGQIDDLYIGSWLDAKVVLLPLPLPPLPDTFDFARFAYFRGIGAIGYAVRRPKVLSQPLETERGIWEQRYLDFWLNVNSVRKVIATRIKENMDSPYSEIIAGMLVGEVSSIDKDDYEALRISGLAHIIAISGMHIAAVAAIVFFATRMLVNRSSFLVLRFTSNKISAFLTIIVSFVYLLLTGAPVSAQRAFIAAFLVLTGVILDQKVEAMKVLAVAAIGIFLLTPEMLLGPGLQMSFAACMALIAVFSQGRTSKNGGRFWQYAVGLTIASAAASLATAPLIMFHFNQFSLYSILSNLLCVPLSDFFIMPLGMVSLLLMPFHLEHWPLIISSYGVKLMLAIAHFVSSAPHASLFVNCLNDRALGWLVLAFCLLTLTLRCRWLAVPALLMAMLSLSHDPMPDLVVSASGKLIAVKLPVDGEPKLVLSSWQAERYVRRIWQQKFGVKNFDQQGLKKNPRVTCSEGRCEIPMGAYNIILLLRQGQRDGEGEKAVIANVPVDYSITGEQWYRAVCEEGGVRNIVINLRTNEGCSKAEYQLNLAELAQHGGHMIYLSDENDRITIKRTGDALIGERPWYSGSNDHATTSAE